MGKKGEISISSFPPVELLCIPFIKHFPWLEMYVGTGVYVDVHWFVLIYMAFMPSGRLLGKLCGSTAIGPKLDRARRYATDELPASLNLVKSDNDQTFDNRI